jgi:hypothetical protein
MDWRMMSDRPSLFSTIAVAVVMLMGCRVHAAFEIETAAPAERGVVAGVALGLTHRATGLSRWMPGEAGHRWSAAIHGFRPFGCREIDFCEGRIVIPVGSSRDAVGFYYRRLKAYTYLEETYAAFCGVRLRDVWIKPVLRLGTVRWEGECVDWAALFDLEVAALIRHDAKVRVALRNPLALGLVKTRTACPTHVSLGLGYLVDPVLAWGVEVRKQVGLPTSILTGIEWALAERLALRTGIRTYPQELSLGLGITVRRVEIDVATSLNLELGATHQLGAAYTW